MKKTYIILLLSWLHVTAIAQTVVQLEYFIDTDAGVGNNTLVTVPPSADVDFSFTADLSGVSVGYHKLYIRTKDSDGKWSLTSRRNIEVIPPQPVNNLVAAEYFFDTDPGAGNGNPITGITPGTDIPINFTATTTSLTTGYHKLYIRTLDQQGKWSLTARRNAEIIVSAAPLYVTGVEYSFGTDPGVGSATYISFPTPLTDGTFSFTIPTNQIPTGADTLYMRVKDSTNKNWSLTALKIKYFITSSCPESIWLGAVSNDWNNPVNWSCNQVPTAITEVIIVSLTTYNCEVLTGNAAVCKKITAIAASNVKVNTGATLMVTGN